MILIGIDPGYAIVGYGVVKYENNRFVPLEYDAITTPAEMPFAERLEKIYRDLTQVLRRHRPEAMSVEKLFFTTNQKTGIDVAQARGVILLAAVHEKIPVYEYTPLQVKSSVVGYGKAVKKQVMEMTRILLGLDQIPKPDDVADALALAITHAHTAGSLLNRYPYAR